ncbi:MAG: segregation/condensation protein A [Candidatus Micrarchaeota archaeon]|nr:segregation/condensation protein A [Candidatus Micrarchaeota archaeon]
MQETRTESAVSVNKFDIEGLVSDPTWKDILVELVKSNELNPWDIDLVAIVEGYIGVVKHMKVLDLRVPANIILAAAILLKLKSDMLELEEKEERVAAEEEMLPPYVPADGLSIRLRLPHKSRVSLNELITALEEAMKLKELKEAQASAPISKPIPVIFNHADVEADAERVLKLVKKNLDGSNAVTYSILCETAKSDAPLLEVFIPLLFLTTKNKVLLLQETFFGEIIVSLN